MTSIAWLAAAAVIAASPVAGDQPAPTSAAGDAERRLESDVLAFADHLLAQGDPRRAILEYERFLFLCPSCAASGRAELSLATALRRAGEPRRAAARVQDLLDRRPDLPEAGEAWTALGEALEAAGDPGAASDAYRRWSERAPADAAEAATRAVRAALRARDPERVRAAAGRTGRDLTALLDAIDRTRPPRRSPVAAGILSAALPGAGHAYVGRFREAFNALVVNALFTAAAVVAWRQESYAVSGVVGGLEVLWYGGSVVGAINAARRWNERAEAGHWRRLEQTHFAPAATISWRF